MSPHAYALVEVISFLANKASIVQRLSTVVERSVFGAEGELRRGVGLRLEAGVAQPTKCAVAAFKAVGVEEQTPGRPGVLHASLHLLGPHLLRDQDPAGPALRARARILHCRARR